MNYKKIKLTETHQILIYTNFKLEKTTGYIRGGCSPIGMKKLFPVYLSKDAEELDKIIVSAGRRGFQVELAPEDLKKLVNAKFANIEA